MIPTSIRLPDLSATLALSRLSAHVESILAVPERVKPNRRFVLDLSRQTRICPWGVLVILKLCRVLSQRSGAPVEIINASCDVYCYLQRVGLFAVGQSWLVCSQLPSTLWHSSPYSPNLLDITLVQGRADVKRIFDRAETIFERWLGQDVQDLLTIFSELCANVHKHSGDGFGCVMAQKYEPPQRDCVRVCVCVADLGVGIRGSLRQCHSDLPLLESECLLRAYNGLSARGVGATGTGLSQAAGFARRSGGHLILRSHTGRLEIDRAGETLTDDLAYFDGTLLAIEFQAPLQI